MRSVPAIPDEATARAIVVSHQHLLQEQIDNKLFPVPFGASRKNTSTGLSSILETTVKYQSEIERLPSVIGH